MERDSQLNGDQKETWKDSSKVDGFQADSESTVSATPGGRDEESSWPRDLEKAETQPADAGHGQNAENANAADWDGPDDPGNPLLWPTWKKIYQTVSISCLAFAVTVGTSMISPATSEIAEVFNVSRTAAILPLTLFTVGLAIGPLIAAPISEMFGRTVVYKATGLLYILFLIGSGFSQSFASLLVCRTFAGIWAGPVLAVGAGTFADMFYPRDRAAASATFLLMAFFGPAFGPVIGGFAAQFRGWRWTQWCTIFVTVFCYALVLPLQETYKKVILSRREKKLGVAGPPKPAMTPGAMAKMFLTITLIRPLHMLVTEPIVLFLSAYNSFTFSVIFAFFAAYPYTFQGVYGFNTWQTGLAFIGISIGTIAAITMAVIIDRKIYLKKHREAVEQGKAVLAPEHRLYAAMIGSCTIPVGLFWFAWTARPSVHWILPILAGIPFAFGNLSVFISAAMYLIDTYGPLAGASAMAANGLSRYIMGSVFPLFTFQMYEAMGIGWATSLLGFVSVVMLPIPWVLYKYGPQVRAKSKYDTIKA